MNLLNYQKLTNSRQIMFDKTIAAKPPTVDYKSIMEADGVAEWTRQIVRMSASTNRQ